MANTVYTFVLNTFLSLFMLSLPTVLPSEAIERSRNFNPRTDNSIPPDRYLKHDEMIIWLKGIARRYPNLARTISIGQSEQGRELLVLELSHSVARCKRDLLMPMVKLVAIDYVYFFSSCSLSNVVRFLSNNFRRLVPSTEMKLLAAK